MAGGECPSKRPPPFYHYPPGTGTAISPSYFLLHLASGLSPPRVRTRASVLQVAVYELNKVLQSSWQAGTSAPRKVPGLPTAK